MMACFLTYCIKLGGYLEDGDEKWANYLLNNLF
jgi:hypothetical protein